MDEGVTEPPTWWEPVGEIFCGVERPLVKDNIKYVIDAFLMRSRLASIGTVIP